MRNRVVKTQVKTAVKKVYLAEQSGDAAAISDNLNTAKSTIDKATKKGVIPPKTAARKISRLTRKTNQKAVS